MPKENKENFEIINFDQQTARLQEFLRKYNDPLQGLDLKISPCVARGVFGYLIYPSSYEPNRPFGSHISDFAFLLTGPEDKPAEPVGDEPVTLWIQQEGGTENMISLLNDAVRTKACIEALLILAQEAFKVNPEEVRFNLEGLEPGSLKTKVEKIIAEIKESGWELSQNPFILINKNEEVCLFFIGFFSLFLFSSFSFLFPGKGRE